MLFYYRHAMGFMLLIFIDSIRRCVFVYVLVLVVVLLLAVVYCSLLMFIDVYLYLCIEFAGHVKTWLE